MGRLFLDHFGGNVVYSCRTCGCFLTNKESMVSNRFKGATGQAYLFEKATNLEYGPRERRMMITGAHVVRDVACKLCKARLGWMYEFAMADDQKYKESHVILEKALIRESRGIRDPVANNTSISRHSSPSTNSTQSQYENHVHSV